MENMELWNKVKQPPASALKKITGGRLSGKTDINPQWRYEAMTENFGICGIGWYFTVDNKWVDDGSEGQKFAFADITLYVKIDGEWSKGIPASGGSMLIEKEKNGLHANDEAFKMSITDALGTAMKMLGLAADIYAGKWDGSKYKDAPEPAKEEITAKAEEDVPVYLAPDNKSEENIIFCTIKDIRTKEGTTTKGAWKLFIIETANGDSYGTFNAEIAALATTLKETGDMGRMEFKQGKKNKEVVSLVRSEE
jgi:hypothetical protein